MGGSFLDLTIKLAPYAQDQGRIYGILPAFIMAVAMLETGYGKSALCNQANNLFSIKGEYNGQSVTMPTTEYVNNKPVKVNAKFRKYPSFKESCHDFCELIKNGTSWNHSIYSKAVIGVADLEKVCVQFGRTPYMTDPSYSGKLLAVIKSLGLAKYDTTPTAPASTHQTAHYKSLVDYLKAIGKDSSFAGRAILAKQHKISNYSGTADQNKQLLSLLQGGK
jgi:flagellum-specific peptidoglycan hydrolase FlgJ